ncbi:MAG: family 43 glycosylhydrolase [Flavisolibacter sp.]|nr:family 43 glycosylhydrolase [Flavisolibacter sp.]
MAYKDTTDLSTPSKRTGGDKSTIALLFSILCCLTITAQRLVLPGDYPDPSVVKIGDTYWASATTSNWFPAYPLLKSKDLINWETTGNVFTTMPQWADFYFWAPEISYDNGKVYIYYAAHKKNGNLCVGVASADRPEGPYKDHGPLICQEVGSIDAFPMRDEAGKLHLIWKEDANSVGKPTPIWIQPLNEERTALTGERKELFRNNESWEKNLVEGVSMIKHGDWFYAFYAAAGCCGAGCDYATGVARSKNLLGPWEKYNKNPVLTDYGEWKCPGHGTPIEKDGRYYFLYHAYNKNTSIYTGREGLLMEFRFTPDGWIEFVQDNAPDVAIPQKITDAFKGRNVSTNWQWSVFQQPEHTIRRGRLQLGAMPIPTGAFLGQKTYTGNYGVSVLVKIKKSDAAAGIGAIGDEKNAVTALVQDNKIILLQVKDGKESIVIEQAVTAKKNLYLQMHVANGKNITFLYSSDGKTFQPLNTQAIDASYLPPWDRAVRAGLIAKGASGQKAVFDNFELRNK